MSLPAAPVRTPIDPLTPVTTGAPERRCRNCHATLTGEFCAACGQRDLPPDPTLGELVGEAWEAFVSVDGKVLSALRLLLLHPGALTTEYLEGHRARHLPPLRLYLVCSVVYFLVSAGLPSSAKDSSQSSVTYEGAGGAVRFDAGEDGAAPGGIATAPQSARQGAARDSAAGASLDSSRRAVLASTGRAVPAGPIDSAAVVLADSLRLDRKIARELGANPSWLKRVFVTRLVRNGARIGRERKTFATQMKEQIPRVMFVLMPVFAALLALAYRSRRRRFPTHLIVSLHLHAFAFGALTLGAVVAALPLGRARSAGLVAVALWMLAYLPLALRRVYGGRLGIAVLRAGTVVTIYCILATIIVSLLAVVLVVLY